MKEFKDETKTNGAVQWLALFCSVRAGGERCVMGQYLEEIWEASGSEGSAVCFLRLREQTR